MFSMARFEKAIITTSFICTAMKRLLSIATDRKLKPVKSEIIN